MENSETQVPPLLELNNIEVIYNHVILVLRGVSLVVPKGGIVALLGGNGAGKTTALRAISGLLSIHDGEITKGDIQLAGASLVGARPASIVAQGVGQAMEGRRIFADLSVEENLLAGAYGRPTQETRQDIEKFYDRFNFFTVGIRKKYYKDGSDALLKEKKLTTK